MRAGRAERGFTLVELMVSLVISGIVLGLVLEIWGRMSLAYRGQQSVAELQQILAAGHAMIEADLRQAGFQLPDGFFRAGDDALHQPVEIVDDADGFGPDQLRTFAADASAVARVQDFNGLADDAGDAFTMVVVDSAADFAPGDVAVIVKAQDGLPTEIAFYPCVVAIQGVSGNELMLATTPPWGTANNDQCDEVRTNPALGPDRRAMVYRLRARAYRIDPARRDLAVLQMSPTGGVVDDWQDLGVGFTDLQIASRWDDTDDDEGLAGVDTADLDADPTREWWSDATQTALTGPLAATTTVPPLAVGSFDMLRPRLVAVRVTLVVRTHAKVDLAPSARTPVLVDAARPANNDLGNRDAVQLEGVSDALRPEELRGAHVYRYATVGTDLRNMGIGL
ncbi:MAG: type II secretion system GspH family protein [Deltaproteobacteria bacterium]|nr:type II secretion system GspH family protein [Kofleriaceae bacterium]